MVPAGYQNGLVSWEALALHLYGDVGQHVPAAEPVEVEQDVARVARELNTAICRHGHSVNLGRGNRSGYWWQEINRHAVGNTGTKTGTLIITDA